MYPLAIAKIFFPTHNSHIKESQRAKVRFVSILNTYLIHTYVNNIRHSMRNCAYDIRKLFHLRTRYMEESVQLFSVPLLQPCLAVHQALNVKRIKDNLRGVTLVRFIATTSREALQIDTWPLFKRIDEGIGPSSYGNFNLLLRRLLKKKKSRKESWESYRVEESRFLI